MADTTPDTTIVPAAFVARLKDLRRKSPTNFTIITNNERFEVHREVLCLQSPVLASAVSDRFKEGRESELDLSEDDAACVKNLVEYLYTFDYTASHDQALEQNVGMYVLADKYDIPHLKQIAMGNFTDDMTDEDSVSQNPDSLATAASIAWDAASATKEIRGVIVRFIVEHNGFFTGEGAGSSLAQLMLDCPQLALDVAAAATSTSVCKSRKGEERFKCPECTMEFVADLRSNPDYACVRCGQDYTTEHWHSFRMVD